MMEDFDRGGCHRGFMSVDDIPILMLEINPKYAFPRPISDVLYTISIPDDGIRFCNLSINRSHSRFKCISLFIS